MEKRNYALSSQQIVTLTVDGTSVRFIWRPYAYGGC
jgi:hypothetical protein